MITRTLEALNPFEEQIIQVCCQEEIHHHIIPSLEQMHSLTLGTLDELIEYISLLEKLIKSAATLQRLLHIKEEVHTTLLNKEIKTLKLQNTVDLQFKKFVALYLQNQGKVTPLLVSPESLFGPIAEIDYLNQIITKAAAGMQYLKTKEYLLPMLGLTHYTFNLQWLHFLKNMTENSNDQQSEILYEQYSAKDISADEFASISTAVAFRLFLAFDFFNKNLIASNETTNLDFAVDNQTLLLQVIHKIRHKN